MRDEVHGYLRSERNRLRSDLAGFHGGRLEVWDIGTQPRRNISDEQVEQLEKQLAATEEIMRKWGVDDA